ncbi:Retinol dehydrogenase 13 [Mactra antiquata]
MLASSISDLVQSNRTLLAIVATFGAVLATMTLFFRGGCGKCTSKTRLDNKTVLITGGNTGIGKETAIDLAKRGAKVLIACRNKQKAETAAEEIKEASGSTNIVVYILDLASLKSVRECADQINNNESQLDILINNAGVMACPYMKTEDGFEMQFGTNHLGHFLFTNLLLDKIKKSSPSRIINVSSRAHIDMSGSINFDDINSEKSYNRFTAYGQSKLANVLFTRELNKRLQGTNVTVYSLHPGVVDTELCRHFENVSFLPFRYLFKLIYSLSKYTLKTSKEGAQTSLYCAVDTEVVKYSGKYFSDCAVKEESLQAKDDDVASRLWTLSEQMVGLKQK